MHRWNREEEKRRGGGRIRRRSVAERGGEAAIRQADGVSVDLG